MIAVDANLLIYAHDPTSGDHPRARAWFNAILSDEPAVGLPLVSILAFMRIGSDPRLARLQKTIAEITSTVSSWIDRGNVIILEPTPRHWPIFFSLLAETHSTGHRVTDAHLAALAIEHGATLYTNDRDFRRFPKLDVRFPLAE